MSSQLTYLLMISLLSAAHAFYNSMPITQRHGRSSFFRGPTPFKIRFTANKFRFDMLASNLTKSVGKLALKMDERTRNFLNLNELNVTMRATRHLSSSRFFKIDPRNLEILLVDRNLQVDTQHYFQVYLFDAYKRYVPTSCSLQIHVLENVNKYAPVFERDLYQAQIVENNAPNTLVVKVS